ncbi:Fc.00g115240.m01.CDS01 [Cosmosporella sp. VM-42]
MTILGSNVTQLKDFLSYLSTFKGDLSNITAPPFVLAPKSAIEIPSAWASRHALFLQVATEQDPAQRALLVAKNYVCSLKQLVDEGGNNEAKKPLNPFLGELFFGVFRDKGSTTHLIAEQVSHHPPVTACFMYNKQRGITSTGFAAQETSFNPSSGVMISQAGYAMVTDEKHAEKHLMTMPTLFIKGIFTGRPYPELHGPCYISNSNGFMTRLDFEGRGKLGLGPRNRIEARIYKSPDTQRPLYSISGQWNGLLVVKDGMGNAIETFHVDDVPITDLQVLPVDQQSKWESRRAWRQVSQGIHEGDANKINVHKSAIEEAQRERRSIEAEKGAEWHRLFFSRVQQDQEAGDLLQRIRDQGWSGFDSKRTAGVWQFIGIQQAENVIKHLR